MYRVRIVLFELFAYGFKAAILFVIAQLRPSEEAITRHLIARERKYKKVSLNKKKQIFKQFFKLNMGVDLEIDNPRTFSEKIQYIKLNSISSKMTMLADKYAVREWITEQIGEKYLVPLLGVWNSFDEIDFSALPNQFCLKTNHGSGMNYVVADKTKLDINRAKASFDTWLCRPFDMVSNELQYKDIPRKIICEEFINDSEGKIYDYKFHCFNGIPRFIQCIGERDTAHHTARHDHFTLEWEKLDWNFECFPGFEDSLSRPKCLEEMIHIAEKLAVGFDYVRVDLYEIDGRVFFGEMTFTPGSGMYPYRDTWNKDRDLEIGSYLKLQSL